mmetsp:Transcript_29217/g.41814  ORF Transcript_29217/g.41814 Transcript_29217/m.41814 type:complete len:106 (+) Transcript_29217:1914-2231(+)
MPFAHTLDNALSLAPFRQTEFLFGSMSNAHTSLHGRFVTAPHKASLSPRPVGTAHTRVFDKFGTIWKAAWLSLGAVRDAQSPLNYTIPAIGECALATRTQPAFLR